MANENRNLDAKIRGTVKRIVEENKQRRFERSNYSSKIMLGILFLFAGILGVAMGVQLSQNPIYQNYLHYTPTGYINTYNYSTIMQLAAANPNNMSTLTVGQGQTLASFIILQSIPTYAVEILLGLLGGMGLILFGIVEIALGIKKYVRFVNKYKEDDEEDGR